MNTKNVTVADLQDLADQLADIAANNPSDMVVAFENSNCWRTLKSRPTSRRLETEVVDVKPHFDNFAPLSVVNGKRGFMDDYTKELLAKPTVQVLKILNW